MPSSFHQNYIAPIIATVVGGLLLAGITFYISRTPSHIPNVELRYNSIHYGSSIKNLIDNAIAASAASSSQNTIKELRRNFKLFGHISNEKIESDLDDLQKILPLVAAKSETYGKIPFGFSGEIQALRITNKDREYTATIKIRGRSIDYTSIDFPSGQDRLYESDFIVDLDILPSESVSVLTITGQGIGSNPLFTQTGNISVSQNGKNLEPPNQEILSSWIANFSYRYRYLIFAFAWIFAILTISFSCGFLVEIALKKKGVSKPKD